MDDKRLPKITSNSSQNHLQLKRGWHKDAKSWLNRYYKEVVNPNLEDQNYLSILRSAKKKINIAKIRTNSHELHSETWHWTTPKTSWDERICHLCDTK
jgi:hypothetical protein